MERGAEPDALWDTYGGGRTQTTLVLLVSSCVPAAAGPDGKPRPDQPHLRIGVGGPELAAAHLVDYALIQAAGHGRREVVELLLSKQPDLTVTEPFFGATARGFANHQGYTEIAVLIGG